MMGVAMGVCFVIVILLLLFNIRVSLATWELAQFTDNHIRSKGMRMCYRDEQDLQERLARRRPKEGV